MIAEKLTNIPTRSSNGLLIKDAVLTDYRIACESRQASLAGRKEVFMGKAKFGIFGDGKELAQIAMAKVFRKGDHRSGYYRDQTFMMALGELTVEQFFAQLYAHTDVEAEPATAGRCMNGHFATRYLDANGHLKNLSQSFNVTADISPTAGQMPRLVGLAYASKLFRENPALHPYTELSDKGNEIAFGTIGNASCAEGMFMEAINAAGVLKVPMLTAIWDDGYGISVPNKYQITKEDLSEILSGFKRKEDGNGFELFRVKGWDYPALLQTFEKAEKACRQEHVPVIVHVCEITQPQGHSTSGSHERYKSKERLQWEKEHDCIQKFREWILSQNYATSQELDAIEQQAIDHVKHARKRAWDAFTASMAHDHKQALELLSKAAEAVPEIAHIYNELHKALNPTRLDALKSVRKALRSLARQPQQPIRKEMNEWLTRVMAENANRYSSHLVSQSDLSPLRLDEVAPQFSEQSPMVDGREVMQACFDQMLARDPRVFAIGEDVGRIGDVNQGFAGLQAKYGELRVTDTGIRETTIIGQGIGAAIRGLRPIAEIQYLDYIFYALATLTDDLACLHYRTKGGQKAPLIIRTRGHRLEGIWHSGSPIGALLHSLRGIHVLVPRNMTKAAGFYNAALLSDDPVLIIECLNGYRLKERLPNNIGSIITPLGIPEIIRNGTDVTVVTYGSMCRIVMEAAEQLSALGIECEVIDVQSLLPFDRHHAIARSVQKTNRVVFADEDVPGGATAFMMQQVLEEQKAYRFLDSAPVTITAKEHRPAYASDGDYFSKPNTEDVFEAIYAMMHEADPQTYPSFLE